MNYTAVDHADIVSPVDEGLYEYLNGSYVLSADAVANTEKTYYMLEEDIDDEPDYVEADVEVGDSVQGLYEYDENLDTYFLTSDSIAIDGKVYYERVDMENSVPYDENALYCLTTEVVENPHESEFYEKTSTGYAITEDTFYDEDKAYYILVEDLDYDLIVDEEEEPEFDFPNVDDIAVDSETGSSEPVVGSDNFLFAYMTFVENPHDEGLYEIVNGVYVVTQDTTVNFDKVYYELSVYSNYYEANMSFVENPAYAVENYYELINGSYVLTQDTTVIPGKTYYRSHIDDEHPYVPDPTIGETPATWEDVPVGE